MIIPNSKQKVLFVHIPKTAGTTITQILKSNELDNWKREKIFNHHDPLFLLEKNNDISDAFKFSIIRNPYKRAFSHYKHVTQTRSIFMTFNDFLTCVRLNGNIRLYDSRFASMFIERLPLISYTQHFYLHDQNGNLSMDKIYKLEKIHEFEIDFDVKLTHMNIGSYTKEEYLTDYTNKNKSLVKHIYHLDFEFFNYSNHFDDSIEGVG